MDQEKITSEVTDEVVVEANQIKEAELIEAKQDVEAPSMTEVIKGKKVITLPDIGEVEITRPTFFVMEDGDKVASSTKLKMLLAKEDKLPSEAQLKKIYNANGAWTKVEEARIDYLRGKIIEIVREINDWPHDLVELGWWNEEPTEEFLRAREIIFTLMNDEEIPDEILDNYARLRGDILDAYQAEHNELRTTKTELFSGTIESFANFERQLFFIIKCFKKDGQPVWNSVDEIKSLNPAVFTQIVSAASRFWSGADSEEMETFFDALQGGQM